LRVCAQTQERPRMTIATARNSANQPKAENIANLRYGGM